MDKLIIAILILAIYSCSPIGMGQESSIHLEKLTNGVDADTGPGPMLRVGDTVTWTYIVTNTGQSVLNEIEVTDNQSVSVTCPADELGPGESMICNASGTAQLGPYANLGTVTAQDENGRGVTDSDPSHYFGSSSPPINIEKATNGFDADLPPGPTLRVGDTVTWTYNVTNTGDSALNDIVVTDDRGVVVSCPKNNLDVGESMTCTGSGTAVAGQYSNVGTATATSSGRTVQDSDSSNYFGVGPFIDIEKLTNGQDADVGWGPLLSAGSPVTWNYVVTNTGNCQLDDVNVTDDQGVAVSCPKTALAPGESMTCTASGIAQLGQYANVGTATGTPEGGGDSVSDSDPSHYYGYPSGGPSISIEKSTNGEDADAPPGPTLSVGSPVTWEYMVTNTGGVPLSNVDVSDDHGVEVVCPADRLGLGGSMTCTASGIAVAGQYSNNGTVTAVDESEREVTDSDPSHYFGFVPPIDIEKRTNGVDADLPPGPQIAIGSYVIWTYNVTNIGESTLTDITVSDSDPEVVIACPYTTLDPGESMECTAMGIAQEGQYSNNGTVTAVDDRGGEFFDSDPSHYFGSESCPINIEKLTNGVDVESPSGPAIRVDDPVTWTYNVTNTGESNLTGIAVTDDQGVAVTCPAATLKPGESMICTASGTAVAGQYRNVGTVKAQDASEIVVSDSDPSYYIGFGGPSIDIEKATNGADADTASGPTIRVGDPVTWTYNVTNTGESTLTDISVTDDQGVAVTCPAATLQPGESMICTASGIAVAGQYRNVGNVTADANGRTVTDSDPSHYIGFVPPIDIEKLTNGVDADIAPGPMLLPGAPITWTYNVTNTGESTLTDITVADDQGVTVTCPADNLRQGESMTCTASGIAVAGQYRNVGTVTAKDDSGRDVTDSDPSHYYGLQNISGHKFDFFTKEGLGGWTIVLSNVTGTLAEKKTDTEGRYEFCGLVPGNYTVCEVQQEGWTPIDPPTGCYHNVTASSENVDFYNDPRNLTITKVADKLSVKGGDDVTYTITVCNHGGSDVANVTIWDVFNRHVEVLSYSPAPGPDGKWHFDVIPKGECMTITIKVKVPERQDFEFGMERGVSGEGFVNVANDYSTTFEAYLIRNCAYATSDWNTEPISACVTVTVDEEVGTRLETREYGSGLIDSDERVAIFTENKSIEWEEDLSAAYKPTTLTLYNNRTVNYDSAWVKKARAKNYVTGTTMTETYHDAVSLDRESRMFLDENESVMEVNSEFDGRGHVGFLKMPSNSSTLQPSPLFEASEDYTGSFKVLEQIDEYGSAVSSEKAASGEGLVVVDKRVGDVQRSYESGTGAYDSEEVIETATNYIAKDISLVHAPTSQTLTDNVAINSSLKWKEGMYSKNPETSYIGEEYTSITELDKETVARGLNDMATDAEFSGRARFRAVLEDEVDFDEEYEGDYSVERRVIFTGVAKYDRPHLNVTKTLEGGIVEETLPWGYNETHLEGEVKTRTVANYVISIENDGNKALGPVYVQDLFPPGSAYIDASLRPSELAETYANWTLMNIGIGDRVVIGLKLDVTRYHPSELVNRVEVCGGINNGEDWVCASNFSALEVDWLTFCPDETVSVTKTAKIDPVNDSVVRYRVEIKNDDVTRVATVTDYLPEGMELVESSIPFASYDGNVVVWNLVEVPASGMAAIEFSALAPGDGRFTNTVEVDARSVDGPVVQPVTATCVIDVGIVEDACGPVSCDVWQPPNWKLEHFGYDQDQTTCEDLTCTSCDGTDYCLAP